MARAESMSSLLEVGADSVDQFAGRGGTVSIALTRWIDDVEADVILHDLGHEAVDRAADGRDELQRLRTARLVLQGPLEGVDLSPDTPHAADEFGLLADRMSHSKSLP